MKRSTQKALLSLAADTSLPVTAKVRRFIAIIQTDTGHKITAEELSAAAETMEAMAAEMRAVALERQ